MSSIQGSAPLDNSYLQELQQMQGVKGFRRLGEGETLVLAFEGANAFILESA